MTARIRVVIANWRDPWHPQAGGAERYAWEMARALAQRGAEVRFLTARAAGQARRDHIDGIQVIRLGGRFSVYPLVLGWLAVHRRSVDVVLDCQNGIPFFTPLVLGRRVPVLCVVHHVHTAQFGVHFPAWMAWVGRLLEGPASRLVYRRHACVAVSPSTVTAMRERLRWTGDIYLIPNGTAVPPTPGRSATGAAAGPLAAAGQPDGPSRLVWIGRLVAHKRAELILPVAERGFAIDVIGRGPGAAALSAAIRSARGAGGPIRLRGYLSEADKQTAISGSLLHLNTSQGEGWGLSVLEAAALGVPTVAYDVEGLRDAVRDGQTGWLVKDGEQLADVVEQAARELADPARRAQVAASCRAWAARLPWERSTARMTQLIEACVRLGTAQGTRSGTWIVSGGDGRGEVVAAGPVLDVLLGAGGRVLRPATPLESMLGQAQVNSSAVITPS
jgi:glycosyltransferase involved in cell wall biosynthesis